MEKRIDGIIGKTLYLFKIDLTMSALTIRGSFVTLLAQVEDTATLKLMFEKCLEIIRKNDSLAVEFSLDLLAELDEAVAQSDDESAAISNEEAFQIFRQ